MDHTRSGNPTILVVDDSEEIRSLLRFWLERKGFRVVEAADGEQAVDIALSEYPDLILMDIGLPQRGGISATYRIRKEPELQNVPIVAVTAYTSAELHQDALKAGCIEVFTKPLDTDRLGELLEQLLPGRITKAGADSISPQQDRRLHARSHLDTALLFDEEGTTTSARVVNISMGGLYMLTKVDLPEGALMTLRIPLGEDDLIAVRAEVVHRNPGHGVGVRFHWPSDNDRGRTRLSRELSTGEGISPKI